MRALLAVLLVGLAACYSPRSVTTGPDGYVGATGAAWQEPLQASLWIDPYTGFSSFDLNRPAHVALFQWQPGSHFRMVYPAIGFGTNQFFHAGRNHLHTQSMLAERRGMRGDVHRARSLGGGVGTMGGPTYFVLVASEEPLRVNPFYGHAPWITRAGWSNNLYTATELLASQIVPSAGSGDWTVAYQMVWFEDSWRPMRDYRWVRCPGTDLLMAVPIDIVRSGLMVCPDGSAVDPPIEGEGDEIPARQIEERLADVRARIAGVDAARADDNEVREMIRQIREARGQTSSDDIEVPAGTLRRSVERGDDASRPVAVGERPVIRPVAQRGEETRGTRAIAPATRAHPVTPRADRTRPQADRSPPRAERPPTPPARRPAAENRPPPRAERPAPPPRPRSDSPRPQRPPPDPDDGE